VGSDPYVKLFFAGTGGMLWVTALAFVQRGVTGMKADREP
jgi:hypothetical protein